WTGWMSSRLCGPLGWMHSPRIWTASTASARLSSGPVSGLQELLVELCFPGTRFRFPVVFPAHQGRQGHQDRFGAPAGLQAEVGAPVPDEVEFHVAAAAIELELPFPLAVLRVAALLGDGRVGRQEVVADAAHERERALETLGIQVIEEQATHAAGFVAVLEEEVLVAPLLVAGVGLDAEGGVAGSLGGLMPVAHVFLETVIGR